MDSSHAYDKMGNITNITLGTARTASFTYVGTTPKINTVTESGIPPRTVSYDAAGNETAVGTGNFTYSPRNYLSDGEGFSYKYDGRGVRTITVAPSGMLAVKRPRRYHFYSPELNLVSETFLATASIPLIQTEYVWFAGQPVGQIDYGFFNTLSWSFTDHLGTPFIQTDSSGNVVWRAEYEPYGRIFALRTPNHYQPLRLPGQEAQETNLLSSDGNGSSERFYNVFRWYRNRWGRYSQSDPLWRGDVSDSVAPALRLYRARYVTPLTGRFVNEDNVGWSASVHVHGYGENNPVTFIDFSGLAAVTNNWNRPVPLKPEDCPPGVMPCPIKLC